MSMRVTTATVYASNARNLQTSISNLSKAQNAASGQSKLQLPSDDPAAVASALQVRGALKANDQYSRNINDATGWLTTADRALSQTSSLLRQARDLVIQGTNGAMSSSARDAVANQLSSVRDALLGQANTSYLGRSIFAGSSDTPAAFGSDYTFTGVTGSSVQRRVGDGQTVRVDVDGPAVFGSGSNSVFSDLDTIINNLRTGADATGGIALIDVRAQAVSVAQGQVGASETSVNLATTAAADQKLTLQSRKSSIEDVDTAQAIMDLTMKNNVYSASLLVTSKALQTNLMDFLR